MCVLVCVCVSDRESEQNSLDAIFGAKVDASREREREREREKERIAGYNTLLSG